MRTSITREEFKAAFRSYRHTARRLEPRDRYNTASENEELVRRYNLGQLVDFSFLNDWTATVRAGRDQGKLMQRVRIVTEPLTENIRYLTFLARFNCVAGEDVRYLPRSRATELGVPDHEDVWVFDAKWAMIINFDEDDRILGYEKDDDPARVLRWLQDWDTAWHYAVSRDEFAARHGVE